ncbi:DUF2813 domain-containing protein [Xylanibacillus composti]|uniref:DUF2813 domain-containing protein n=1 Tax=Xylanibacillus composti TaxID=1572762 RepID=A0A8J4M4J4_9BACL|nr:AAA family ATPase [Xylanibacillus composti]MDT9723898.1 DUF2813 domain-containing protein [Xylanibacillus composti]GIQ71317.1 hypothetical protein XYCOK13_41410 [Xylanibacillus composti]
MSILVKTIRVSGLRGLQNIEVHLEKTTVITGMNNTGKTSLLKALQIALGNSQFVSYDDFYVSEDRNTDKIVIDVCIVPMDETDSITDTFSDQWEALFTDDRIKLNNQGNFIVPLRTVVTYDPIKTTYKSQKYVLSDWPSFRDENQKYWFDYENGSEKNFNFEEIPFFYIDAQRDILEDMKVKSSYLGKMISKIEYSQEDIEEIEEQIKILNEQAVSRSSILSDIKTTLRDLNTAMDTSSEGVDITPFTKKIRDLNKGLSIYYSDNKDSFSMEYHGMGTRSWSSLLVLKSFVNLLNKNALREHAPFFPILAIEEPEAHLHPNAQKKLYSQISGIKGQKIISTHSPYVAASCELNQIRNFYKDQESVGCGSIDFISLKSEDIRKIRRQVINTRGELFFSRSIIFIEGETEEQALPLFFEKYFGVTPIELGVDIIGVGGYGNYLPFIRFADALSIPWFILSDAEAKVVDSVTNQFLESNSSKLQGDVITFLHDGNDFEAELVSCGYREEIKDAILKVELPQCYSPQHEQAKEREIVSYNDEKLLQIISSEKTRYGHLIAESIINREKEIPDKVKELFNKLESVFRSVADE